MMELQESEIPSNQFVDWGVINRPIINAIISVEGDEGGHSPSSNRTSHSNSRSSSHPDSHPSSHPTSHSNSCPNDEYCSKTSLLDSGMILPISDMSIENVLSIDVPAVRSTSTSNSSSDSNGNAFSTIDKEKNRHSGTDNNDVLLIHSTYCDTKKCSSDINLPIIIATTFIEYYSTLDRLGNEISLYDPQHYIKDLPDNIEMKEYVNESDNYLDSTNISMATDEICVMHNNGEADEREVFPATTPFTSTSGPIPALTATTILAPVTIGVPVSVSNCVLASVPVPNSRNINGQNILDRHIRNRKYHPTVQKRGL